MEAESEVGSLEPEEEIGRAFVCGSAAGGMVRHSRGARGLRSKVKGLRSKVGNKSY